MPVVLVTGCSTGCGRPAALAFAHAGHTVVATMRDLSRGDGPGEAHPNLEVVTLDVAEGERIHQALRARDAD